MLLRPPLGNRCGNSLAGAIPAGVFAIGTVGALGSGRALAAAGGLALTAAFTALAVRCFRMRAETTDSTLTVHGVIRARRIAGNAIVSIDEARKGYAALRAAAPGVAVPSVRWRDAEGQIHATPVWALATSYRELGSWRRSKALQLQHLQTWVNADERSISR